MKTSVLQKKLFTQALKSFPWTVPPTTAPISWFGCRVRFSLHGNAPGRDLDGCEPGFFGKVREGILRKEVGFFRTRLILTLISLWGRWRQHVKLEDLEIDSLKSIHFLTLSMEKAMYPRNLHTPGLFQSIADTRSFSKKVHGI